MSKESATAELERTMEKYKDLVYGMAVTQLGSISDAEDVFQEVFLLYFRKAIPFGTEELKRSWLIKTTIFKCRQVKHSIWNTRVDKSETVEGRGAAGLLTEEENEVLSAVRELPDKYRVPVYLRYFVGLSVEEIGRALGIGSNAVSARLSRARKRLEKRLEGSL